MSVFILPNKRCLRIWTLQLSSEEVSDPLKKKQIRKENWPSKTMGDLKPLAPSTKEDSRRLSNIILITPSIHIYLSISINSHQYCSIHLDQSISLSISLSLSLYIYYIYIRIYKRTHIHIFTYFTITWHLSIYLSYSSIFFKDDGTRFIILILFFQDCFFLFVSGSRW